LPSAILVGDEHFIAFDWIRFWKVSAYLARTDRDSRPANRTGRDGVLSAWATDVSVHGKLGKDLALPLGG